MSVQLFKLLHIHASLCIWVSVPAAYLHSCCVACVACTQESIHILLMLDAVITNTAHANYLDKLLPSALKIKERPQNPYLQCLDKRHVGFQSHYQLSHWGVPSFFFSELNSVWFCWLLGAICSCSCVYTCYVSGGEAGNDSQLSTTTTVSLEWMNELKTVWNSALPIFHLWNLFTCNLINCNFLKHF